MQTRRQATLASFPVTPKNRVPGSFLKEVRIPAARRRPASVPPVTEETKEQKYAPVSGPLQNSAKNIQPTKMEPLQITVVQEVFDTALRPPPSSSSSSPLPPPPPPPPPPQYREVLQALQYRIGEYIANLHDPAWQPWPSTPAYAPDTLKQVLEELHSIATHEWLCACEDRKQDSEALAHAMLFGMRLLERFREGGGEEGEEYRDGVTEMHLAVYTFVEQVVEKERAVHGCMGLC